MDTGNEIVIEKKRPIFLTVLCVIAFLHVGMSILTGFIATLMSPELGWFRPTGVFGLFTDGLSSLLGFYWQIVLVILSVISFFGIIQIWNMRRSGVLVFSIPLFANIIIPLIMLGIAWWILIPNIILIFFLISLFALNYQKLAWSFFITNILIAVSIEFASFPPFLSQRKWSYDNLISSKIVKPKAQ